MIQQNWLVGYSTIEGIKKTLSGMARRSQYGQILQGSEQFLLQHENVLENKFFEFFSILKNEVEKHKSQF
jgi:acyl carrier protein phosphodiesterase